MTKEDAIKMIKEAKARIAEAEAILGQKEEIVLEYDRNCYYIDTNKATTGLGSIVPSLEHARYRDTEEQASQALQREKEVNRLEARALKIDPNWKANWEDEKQTKWSIYYDYDKKKYEITDFSYLRDIGVVYMSEKTAIQLCKELNGGRYKL